MFEDIALVKVLIDQVYRFSRMYWKKFDQQSLPVMIKYPAMVAESSSTLSLRNLLTLAKQAFGFVKNAKTIKNYI